LEREGAEVGFAALSAKTEGDSVAADLLPMLLMSEQERAEGEVIDDVQAAAEGCLNALRLMKIDRRIRELSEEIAAAERSGDLEKRDQLIPERLACALLRNTLNYRTSPTPVLSS
jgi:hypothetical protein